MESAPQNQPAPPSVKLLRALERCRKSLLAIYDATEGCADGAPDASAHDKLCNQISALAKDGLNHHFDGVNEGDAS